MSCDEAVTAGLDRRGKQEYAKELLRFSVNSQQWIQFAVSFAEKGVKGRIMNLLQKKSKTKCAVAMGTAVVIMAGVALLPDFLGQGLTKAASGETKADKIAEEQPVEVVKKEYVVKAEEQPIELVKRNTRKQIGNMDIRQKFLSIGGKKPKKNIQQKVKRKS